MERLIDPQKSFISFLKKFENADSHSYYSKTMRAIGNNETKSIVINFNDLSTFDSELAHNVIEDSEYYLKQFRLSLCNMIKTRYHGFKEKDDFISIKIQNLPKTLSLSELGARTIGKLLMVNGVVIGITAVRPIIINAAFKCTWCGKYVFSLQNGFFIQEPLLCKNCLNNYFNLDISKSSFIDSQWLTIRDKCISIKRKINVLVCNDDIGIAKLNDDVKIVGILKLLTQSDDGIFRNYDLFIKSNNIEVINKYK